VYIQKSQQAGGSPMLRGFSTNRVLLVVDGVRMNNAIFRTGNLQNVISLDAGSVESAEVLSARIGDVRERRHRGRNGFSHLGPRLSSSKKASLRGAALPGFRRPTAKKPAMRTSTSGFKNGPLPPASRIPATTTCGRVPGETAPFSAPTTRR
jgi:hemoglobin/transferrin/lactoferrin receptor protein